MVAPKLATSGSSQTQDLGAGQASTAAADLQRTKNAEPPRTILVLTDLVLHDAHRAQIHPLAVANHVVAEAGALVMSPSTMVRVAISDGSNIRT